MTTKCRLDEAYQNPTSSWAEEARPDHKCAFDNEGRVFSPENFQCQTAMAIRDLYHGEFGPGFFARNIDDEMVMMIPVHDIKGLGLPPDGQDDLGLAPQPLFLYVGWYKMRGRVEQMWIMCDSGEPRRPTEDECLLVLHHYKVELALIAKTMPNRPPDPGAVLTDDLPPECSRMSAQAWKHFVFTWHGLWACLALRDLQGDPLHMTPTIGRLASRACSYLGRPITSEELEVLRVHAVEHALPVIKGDKS